MKHLTKTKTAKHAYLSYRGIKILKEMEAINPAGDVPSCEKLFASIIAVNENHPFYEGYCNDVAHDFKSECEDHIYGRQSVTQWLSGAHHLALTTSAVITFTFTTILF